MLTKAAAARVLDVTPQMVQIYCHRGMPLTSEAEVTTWYEVNVASKKKKAVTHSDARENLAMNDEDLSLDKMLERLRMAEAQAGREVEQAAPGADKQAALRAYNQAAKNRCEIEAEIIRVKREARELLTPDQCEEVLAKLRPVVAKMDTAAQSLGFKCNPSDPELAMGHISDYFEGLKAMFRDALGEEAAE